MSPLKVTVLLADGTKGTYTVHKDSTYDVADDTKLISAITPTTGQEAVVPAGSLIEYTSIVDGAIKIKSVVTANAITAKSGDNYATVWNKTTKNFTYTTGGTTAVAASDAVLFVKKSSTGKYYAYNLRDLGTIPNTESNGVSVAYFKDSDTGLINAAYAELDDLPGSNTADNLYGIVTGYVGTRQNSDGDTVYQYTVAVGRDEDVTVSLKDTSTTFKAGDIVTFKETTSGEYASTDLTKIVDTSDTDGAVGGSFYAAAVKDYNESSRLLSYYASTTRANISSAYTNATTSSYTVSSDVKIYYVDEENNKQGADVGVAAYDPSTGYANAVFHLDTDGLVDVIIVETSGKGNLGYNANNSAAGGSFGTKTNGSVSLANPAAVAADSPKGAYKAEYSVSSAEAGTIITVTVTCTTAPASGTDTVTLTTDSNTHIAGSSEKVFEKTWTATSGDNGDGTGVVGVYSFTLGTDNIVQGDLKLAVASHAA
jgi:hypothetical protein